MNFVLRMKHWQLFLILMVASILTGGSIENNQSLTTILFVIGWLIYFLWILLVGHGLYQLLPGRIHLNYNLFIFNSIVWSLSYLAIMVISDGERITFNGLAVLPGLYVAYASLYSIMFPVRTLRSIEKGRKVAIGECLGDFLLVTLLPIGIWFLQPRINKVAQQQSSSIAE